MGAIESIASAESFQAGSVYSNTAEYRGVKRDLTDVADRLSGLIGNMGIEGRSAEAIDQSLTALITNIRQRSDNIDQLADARNTATDGGSTAGQRSQVIQPDADYARKLIASDDPRDSIRGEQMLMRLEIDADTALRALQARTDQAISELPVVFPEETSSGDGGGDGAMTARAARPGGSAPAPYAVRSQSATSWIPQTQNVGGHLMGPGSQAAYVASTASATHPDPVPFTAGPTAHPGAVAEQVSQPVHEGFAVGSSPETTVTATVNVPYTPSESGGGMGVAKAAAGAAALPAMARAVARAQSSLAGGPRGAGRASAKTGARAATPRTGASARAAGSATPRAGAGARSSNSATRGSSAARSSASPRAGVPARAASARGTASARTAGSGSARTSGASRATATSRAAGSGTARRSGMPARGATAGSRQAAPRASSARGVPAGRGGVTVPRQGAARSASGRGMAGRATSGGSRSAKKTAQFDSFTAAEFEEDVTITFIEAGSRDE